MRVFLRTRGDGGAVAIIVAMLTIVIVGLAAFATDFGMAYTSKRNLQKGADAAALAAASEIVRRSTPTDTCTAISARYQSDATFRTAVQGAADAYAQANRLSATRLEMFVQCSTDKKRVEVTYTAGGTTPRMLGAVFGAGDYSTSRTAKSDLFVPPGTTGLRPYFLCVSDLTRLKQGGITQIRYEKDSAPCGEFSGNWYTANCPVFQGQGDLADYTLKGCAEEVKIIEPVAPDIVVTQTVVEQECSPNLQTKTPSGCLVSNPGQIASGNVNNGTGVVGAWDQLFALPGIAVPVFNTQWKAWADAANTSDCRVNSAGSNGCYPIEAIATVKVCGYKWKNKDGLDPSNALPASPCLGVASQLAALDPNDQDNYLWLRLVSLQTTGSTTPSTCGLGDACDAGLRRTRLIE